MGNPDFIEDADGNLVNLAHVARIRAKLVHTANAIDGDAEWAVYADISGFAHATLVRGLASEAKAQAWMRTEFGAAIQGTSV